MSSGKVWFMIAYISEECIEQRLNWKETWELFYAIFFIGMYQTRSWISEYRRWEIKASS
jgi:hypothetical protein